MGKVIDWYLLLIRKDTVENRGEVLTVTRVT